MPQRLFLIRHGQVEANVERRYIGLGDQPLTPAGAAQADALAALFADLELAAVYTSPLRRARDTATAVAGARGLVPIIEDRLTEMSFGEWEGRTHAELLATGGDTAERLARWQHDPTLEPPGGESLAAVQRRVIELVEGLSHPGPVALVSHVGPIKALLCAALDLPLTGTRRVFLDPATVSVVDWAPTPIVRLVNSHCHLGWAQARWLREG